MSTARSTTIVGAAVAMVVLMTLPVVTTTGLTSASATTQGDISVGDGTRTLIVSATDDLDPEAQRLRVRGSGFDVTKGIYVGLCVIQGDGQQPSPCGGGIDRSGSSGASAWISSNPPSYGLGLAVPYADGGSFDVEITVSAAVNAAVDCRRVACAIVTKNDHTIINDRSQDLVVPVTFTGEPPPITNSSSDPSSSAETSSSDPATQITVTPGVEDLTGVATSSDGGSGVNPVIIGVVALIAVGSAVVVVIRRTRARHVR